MARADPAWLGRDSQSAVALHRRAEKPRRRKVWSNGDGAARRK